jgi:hypothetical protein
MNRCFLDLYPRFRPQKTHYNTRVKSLILTFHYFSYQKKLKLSFVNNKDLTPGFISKSNQHLTDALITHKIIVTRM